MAHDDKEDPGSFHAEDRTIGMRLYGVLATISEVAHNAETVVELNDDPSGEWAVAADTLWQVRAALENIMKDLGVKTPDDLRKIQAHDHPPVAADNNTDVLF